MSDKIFINGMFIKEFKFEGGGSILKTSINVETFIEQLKKYENNGWVNLEICSNRNGATEKGYTHHITLNTWKPNKEEDTNEYENNSEEDSSDLPF